MDNQVSNQDQATQMSELWVKFNEQMENKEVITLSVDGIVNGGVICNYAGVRGFVPASMVDLGYVEDLNGYLGKEIRVQIIEVDEAKNRLVLSAKEVLKAEARAAKQAKIEAVEVGTVFDAVVDNIKDFGAFVNIEGGISGLVHISQISQKRIKTPEEVLKVGDEVKVKVIGIKDGKLKLSMKALEEQPEEEKEEVFELPEAEDASTTLGDLFKNIKLN